MDIELIKEYFGNKTILYVEDDDVARTITQRMLNRVFLNVIVAENGQDGFELYKKNMDCIDIVLTDIDMPILNGIEMTKMIKNISTAKPIIFISAFKDEMSKNLDLVDGMIEKPVKRDELFNEIYDVLHKVKA